jgi:hypothetical protein
MSYDFELRGGPAGPGAQAELARALREAVPSLALVTAARDPEWSASMAEAQYRGDGLSAAMVQHRSALEARSRLSVDLADDDWGVMVSLSPEGTGRVSLTTGARGPGVARLLRFAWRCLAVMAPQGFEVVDVQLGRPLSLEADFEAVVSAYVVQHR